MIADAASGSGAASTHGYLLVFAIIIPVCGVMLAAALGRRNAERVAFAFIAVGLVVGIAILSDVYTASQPLAYSLGNWAAPLGITLRADGISAVMLVVTALIIAATAIYARADFATPPDTIEVRAPYVFWVLLLAVWGALNTVFLGSDLFNLYVALELLTFAAVPLVSLSGRAEAIAAALRYLLFALAGSVFYLLGVGLLYGAYGTLDIALLHQRIQSEPAVWLAVGLMTAGLLAKTALFPLHFWLPPAHAGAPPAASAILSALVVKGSFFLIIRIWFDVLPAPRSLAGAQLLGGMGAAAILVGSIVAFRQTRLKLLIAYSTVAQIGYLFLLFPLVVGFEGSFWSATAWTGGWVQLVSHAFAKAAMFMAAGLIAQTLGHDRIGDLGGVARVLPLTVLAFAISGISLMGVPPSGGFVAKWLMLTASLEEGQWWWAVTVILGGLIAGAYVIRVVSRMLGPPSEQLTPAAVISCWRQAVPLSLAMIAVLLGFLPLRPLELLQIGIPRFVEGAFP